MKFENAEYLVFFIAYCVFVVSLFKIAYDLNVRVKPETNK